MLMENMYEMAWFVYSCDEWGVMGVYFNKTYIVCSEVI